MNGLYYIKQCDNVIETYKKGNIELGIIYDNDALSPREWETVGKMVCWHRGYNLGDKHDYDSPEDFLRYLLMEILEDDGVFDASGLLEILRGKRDKYRFIDYDGTIRVFQQYYVHYKRRYEWGMLFEFEGTLEELSVNDYYIESLSMEMDSGELMGLILESKMITILPLYLYDHSGISMSTGSFVGRAQHAEWDSGQVGWIYGKSAIEDIEKILKSEVEVYSNYLEGNVYGYELYDGDELIDSCYGFYGMNYEENIKECLPEEYCDMLD